MDKELKLDFSTALQWYMSGGELKELSKSYFKSRELFILEQISSFDVDDVIDSIPTLACNLNDQWKRTLNNDGFIIVIKEYKNIGKRFITYSHQSIIVMNTPYFRFEPDTKFITQMLNELKNEY